MKKILLLTILLTIPAMAHAEVTVYDSTESTHLQNQGFSQALTDTVDVAKARAAGKELYTAKETKLNNQNRFTRFWRKLYAYTDPAAEDFSFYHHDIDSAPKYTDF